MNCHKLKADLISGNSNPEVDRHLAECESCRELYRNVNNTMALLEQETDIPVNLAAKILARKDEIELPKVRRLNISNYIQIAAAILFGIFVGHKFGEIANAQTDKIKQDPTSQYFKAHHFNIDNADFNSPTKFLTN